jgi:uncharacterized protein (DUF736 family)
MSRAQITCGELKTVKEGSVQFRGPVRLVGRLTGTLEITTAARQRRTEDAPNFDVFYKPIGQDVIYPIGAGWLKNSARVDGGDFMSLTLIHPDWPDDLSLAAYPDTDGTTFRLVYSRPRGAKLSDQPAAA